MKVPVLHGAEDYITDAAVRASATRIVEPGSVLVVTRSGILQRTLPVAVNAVPVALNQDLKAITPSKGVDTRFLFWLLVWLGDEILRSCTKAGTTVASVETSRLQELEVPIAPLAEQRRIVAVLEEHLSALDAAVAGLERARANVERYRLAVRAAAVAESESVEKLTVGDLAQVGTGATPLRSRAAYYEKGSIPWVTSGALNAGVVREASDFVTDLALRETNLTMYPPGTLLVAMYGEGKTRGRCAELAIHATTNQAVAAIQVRPERADVGPWLRLVLDASYEAMRRSAFGGVQPNLNLSIVRAIPVPVPSRSERERILSGVERCLGAADRAAVDIDTQLARATRLHQSILKVAFEGRLVPQDPTDEPAAVFLARSRAEQSTTVSAPRARATTKSTRRTRRR